MCNQSFWHRWFSCQGAWEWNRFQAWWPRVMSAQRHTWTGSHRRSQLNTIVPSVVSSCSASLIQNEGCLSRMSTGAGYNHLSLSSCPPLMASSVTVSLRGAPWEILLYTFSMLIIKEYLCFVLKQRRKASSPVFIVLGLVLAFGAQSSADVYL